ncbi:MAG TPA: NAD-dependent epimerase/dehydratase family protein [Chthoniobacterales bacterium]|nr:NAD-dependent epimerase/dehydratase family protein [Chthoniobacterales bacterium]
MPRLLIAGCGYLGQAVADLFLDDRWEVEAWTLSAETAQMLSGKNYPVHAVDISSAKEVAARSGQFDVVLHCASTRGGDAAAYRRVYLDGARNLSTAFTRARLLFMSSTSVYAQTAGEWVNEESAAEPRAETGKILREAEESVLSNEGTVARLGGIYGPGRSALLTRFLNGSATLDPSSDRFVNEIHRDDAAAAAKVLTGHNGSIRQIYNVVDNEPMLLSECYGWLATKVKRPVPGQTQPAASRKRGESNKRVSNAKLRALGWAPRFPNFASGMEKSVLQNTAHRLA